MLNETFSVIFKHRANSQLDYQICLLGGFLGHFFFHLVELNWLYHFLWEKDLFHLPPEKWYQPLKATHTDTKLYLGFKKIENQKYNCGPVCIPRAEKKVVAITNGGNSCRSGIYGLIPPPFWYSSQIGICRKKSTFSVVTKVPRANPFAHLLALWNCIEIGRTLEICYKMPPANCELFYIFNTIPPEASQVVAELFLIQFRNLLKFRSFRVWISFLKIHWIFFVRTNLVNALFRGCLGRLLRPRFILCK